MPISRLTVSHYFNQNIFLCSEWNAKMPIKSPPPQIKKKKEGKDNISALRNLVSLKL